MNSKQRRNAKRHWKYRFLTKEDRYSIMGVMFINELIDQYHKRTWRYTWTYWADESTEDWRRPIIVAFNKEQDAAFFMLKWGHTGVTKIDK